MLSSSSQRLLNLSIQSLSIIYLYYSLTIVITPIKQEDLKAWVNNITTSISEHEEIAKRGQPQPTTSSTDEGTRREGSKLDNRSEKGAERSDRADRIERADKEKEKEIEKDREKGERSEKSDRGGKRSEKSGKKK